MTNATQLLELTPGDRFETVNESPKAIQVTIGVEDGTEVQVALHPGASLDLKAGTGKVTIVIADVPGPQHLRKV